MDARVKRTIAIARTVVAQEIDTNSSSITCRCRSLMRHPRMWFLDSENLPNMDSRVTAAIKTMYDLAGDKFSIRFLASSVNLSAPPK